MIPFRLHLHKILPIFANKQWNEPASALVSDQLYSPDKENQ